MKHNIALITLSIYVTFYSAPIVRSQATWSSDSTNGFTGVSDPASCVIGGKIYVVGGEDDPYFDGNTNRLQIFDPDTHVWAAATNLRTGRYELACSAVNGKIYAFGGLGTDSSDNVEVFDTSTNEWDSYPSMLTPRYGLTSCVVNDKIYAIGGYGAAGYLSVVEIFDTTTNTWSTGQPMPTQRANCTSSVVNGKIYVIGGIGYHNPIPVDSVEIFDPSTNLWSFGPSMSCRREYCSSSVVDGKIYVIGGYGPFFPASPGVLEPLDSLEIFDPSTNTWSTGPEMPTARYGLCSGVVNGKIYALSGSSNFTDAANTNEVFTPGSSSVLVATLPSSAISLTSSPNPFSQSTQITFTSPDAGYADISIVNLLGEQAARVFSGEMDAGQHNFTFSNTAGLPDGIYECLIRINGRVETLPMALVH